MESANFPYQHFFSVFLASTLYLTSYFFEYHGELDFASFYHSKVNSIIYPEVFPKNDPEDLYMWREVARLTQEQFDRDIYDFGTIDIYTDIFQDSAHPRQLMRIYNSNVTENTGNNNQEQRDVVVWIHDGGWVMGSVEEDDEICYKLANGTNFLVVSPSYRLAPEYPFPTPINDVSAALRWVHEHISEYGGKVNKIYVTGSGAGANLATAAVARNLDPTFVQVEDRVSIIGLIVVHPSLQLHSRGESYEKHGTLNGRMTTKQLEHTKALYLGGNKAAPNNYSFAPAVAPIKILRQFPNTVMMLAKHDILYSEGIAFANTLRAKYVPVDTLVYNSTIYGFFGKRTFPVGEIALRDACYHLNFISSVYPDSYFVSDEEANNFKLPPFPS